MSHWVRKSLGAVFKRKVEQPLDIEGQPHFFFRNLRIRRRSPNPAPSPLRSSQGRAVSLKQEDARGQCPAGSLLEGAEGEGAARCVPRSQQSSNSFQSRGGCLPFLQKRRLRSYFLWGQEKRVGVGCGGLHGKHGERTGPGKRFP